MLEPIQALIENALFWRDQRDGIAMFRSPDVFRIYHLPYPAGESVVVGLRLRLHLKPLLPFLLDGEQQFYLLALSQNTVVLLEGTRHHISEVELPETVPRSLAEALTDQSAERHLQVYVCMPMGTMRQVARGYHAWAGGG